jgi:phage terminase large subunit-like protein
MAAGKAAWAASPFTAGAHQYALDIRSGKRAACQHTIKAAKRYLDDLAKSKRKDWPYQYDIAAAARVCRFIEAMVHTKGKWAAKRETLKLEPWQLFFVCNVFGWMNKATGKRRFRQAYLRVPRKNGKSALAAAIGLYMLTADGEAGAEVYSGASSEKQAWEVFGPARIMALRNAPFKSKAHLTINASNLHVLGNGSKFEPVIGKPGDGASPSCAIIDEYHEHQTDDLVDTMMTGMGAREQPLLLIITTAGSTIGGPCYAYDKDAQSVLSGTIERDELFALIYGIDQGDSWAEDAALVKANPNYDISVSAEFLRARRDEALSSPRKAAIYKTKHLNEWVSAGAPYFDSVAWEGLADDLDIERLVADGWDCYFGLDLASKKDLTAIVLLFTRFGEDGNREFRVVTRFFVPEAQAEDPRSISYREWDEKGFLTLTGGNVIDEPLIEAEIVDLAQLAGCLDIGFDPWGSRSLCQRLQDEHGLTVTEVPQVTRNLSEPMKTVDAAITAGRLRHDGNPVMAWCMANVCAKEDKNENVFPYKERPEAKIDGAAALLNAMARVLSAEGEGGVSVFDLLAQSDPEEPVDSDIDQKILADPKHPRWQEMRERWEAQHLSSDEIW